jgi:hypothetical protein
MEGIDKLSRIPPYVRRRIVTLSENGLNNCKIRDTLIREDNVQISRPGISLFLKRYNATGVIDDQNKGNCANVRKKFADEHLRFICDVLSLIIFIPLFNPLLDQPLKMYRYHVNKVIIFNSHFMSDK